MPTGKKVLLVGGAEPARAAMTEALEAAGHTVSAAITRRFTNRWLSRRIKPFDLIVYDLVEADQSEEFWPELRSAAGATPVIIIATRDDRRDYGALGFERVLRHPLSPGVLVDAASSL